MVNKCGCGRDVRYMTRTGDACNKYGRCKENDFYLVKPEIKDKSVIEYLEEKIASLSEIVAEKERRIAELHPQAIRWALIEEMMFAGNVSLNQDEDGGYSISLDPVDNYLFPTFTGNSPEEVMDTAITEICKE